MSAPVEGDVCEVEPGGTRVTFSTLGERTETIVGAIWRDGAWHPLLLGAPSTFRKAEDVPDLHDGPLPRWEVRDFVIKGEA